MMKAATQPKPQTEQQQAESVQKEEVKNNSELSGGVTQEAKAKQEPPEVATPIEESHQLEEVKPAEIKNGQLVLTPKHLELIKTQIAKEATTDEFNMFLMMAYRTRLDPLMKQLYFIKYGNNVSYVTSIDGYRIIAGRSNDFAGIDEPRYEYDKLGKLTHCAITVYRIVQGLRVGFSAKVKFTEYNTGKNLWSKMPETMIAKVAEAHALRKAFPNDLSGIYTQDEMDQAGERPQPIPRPIMISKPQAQKITDLIQQKNLPVERVKAYVQKAYKRNSIKDLTLQQAGHLIGMLEKQPNPVPAEDVTPEESETTPTESFEEFVNSELAEKESDQVADDVMKALG